MSKLMKSAVAASPTKDRLITTAYVAGAALISATVIIPIVISVFIAIKEDVKYGLIALAIALTGIGPLLLILVTGVLAIVNRGKFGKASGGFCGFFAYLVPILASEKFRNAFNAHFDPKEEVENP